MRNYFMYPPLEWRKQDQACQPQGPSFSQAPSISILIGGSVLRFKAPRHSPSRRTMGQARPLRNHDWLDEHSLASFGGDMMANNHWGGKGSFYRLWAFWGPWMTGCKAELEMSVSVIGRLRGFEFPDTSYFHPRAFEAVLSAFLDDYYGHHSQGNTPRYLGPVDWQRHQHLPVFSGSFKILKWADGDTFVPGVDGGDGRLLHHGKDITQTAYPERLFVFPITDNHFLLIKFVQHVYSWDKNDKDKVAFDTQPIQKLQDDIFNSITLELSPEAKASYERIKAEHRNMQLSKEFAPLKWPTAARTPGETVPEGKCHHDSELEYSQSSFRS